MRVAIIVGVVAALAAAFPHPQGDDPTIEDPPEETEDPVSATPTIPLPLTTSLNIPVTGIPTLPSFQLTSTSKKRPHWEPIPIFTKQCQCSLATARYPCWATDALQVSFNLRGGKEDV